MPRSTVDAGRCAGGTDVLAVGTVLTVNDSVTVTLSQVQYCSLAVRVRWVPGGALNTVAVTGFDTLKVVSGGANRSIEIDAVTKTAVLQ